MTLDSALDALGDERFVSLTTFRKSGEGVSTPVWIARDGDALVVTTPEGTGKVKRLRNSARVELRPCDRMGKVKEDVASVAARAEIVTVAGVTERLNVIFLGKYKLEYRIIMLIERLAKKGRRDRVMLRITSA
ncbi:MAG: PPOX class F420-dependent oxidoreductase [Cryobacterium sp.]|uniref:PPOX class F420-dependent oxidoreductase n=1 Tax=unclassified Cryobacterium TaxID=2649013 RepID=UPI001A2A2D6C|nr:MULTISPECIES: PPOX class F420-dependent oxidoreductase [unclassified Cryobacterium]MCY7405104.1 PPOX class F420-dependent oxidoreductase [Cryobacterium sp.]